MKEQEDLAATVRRVFSRVDVSETIEESVSSTELWEGIVAVEIDRVGFSEDFGGNGGTQEDAATVLKASSEFGHRTPLAEMLLAGWLCEKCRIVLPPGSGTTSSPEDGLEPVLHRNGLGWELSGSLASVPWGAAVDYIATPVRIGTDRFLAVVPSKVADVAARERNLAGEPLDTLRFDRVFVPNERISELVIDPFEIRLRGALFRCTQIGGAMNALLIRTIQYASERKQFGRPIAQFQAVQQMIALLAEETAAAMIASDAARNENQKSNSMAAVAAAKVRTSIAATKGSAIAHQLHGAIGLAYDYPLHRLTTHLWDWRDDYGGERFWTEQLGNLVLAISGEELWPSLVTGLDRRA